MQGLSWYVIEAFYMNADKINLFNFYTIDLTLAPTGAISSQWHWLNSRTDCERPVLPKPLSTWTHFLNG